MKGIRQRATTRPTLASPARRAALSDDATAAWVTADVSRYDRRHVLIAKPTGERRFAAAAFLFEMATERVTSVLFESDVGANQVERLRAFLESRDGAMTPCSVDDARAAIAGGIESAGGIDAIEFAREACDAVLGASASTR